LKMSCDFPISEILRVDLKSLSQSRKK